MPDSFSELRTAGGPNKPWVIGGVLALITAIIGIALAAAYWYSNPRPTPPNDVPATVTVTAQPQLPIDDPSANCASNEDFRSSDTSTIGGSSDSDMNALTVVPCGSAAVPVVTIATAAASWLIASLNAD